jgi:uncharacterized protein (DUF924 family)
METHRSILDFWFGQDADRLSDATVAGRQSKLWWGKDSAVDAGIRRRFESLVRAAAAGELEDWEHEPEARLALILLTDQFPRNIYRGTAAMFACDETARRLCDAGLATGADRALRPIQRVFFYLPLEHAEDAGDQARCVALMRALVDEADAAGKTVFEGFLDYAVAHQRIVDRFGRFPHRNDILGRESTDAEREFLTRPGSSF